MQEAGLGETCASIETDSCPGVELGETCPKNETYPAREICSVSELSILSVTREQTHLNPGAQRGGVIDIKPVTIYII